MAKFSDSGEMIRLMEDRAYKATKDGKLTVLAACTFAGAFNIGAEDAGFTIVGQLEPAELGGFGVKTASRKWPVAVLPLQAWKDVTLPKVDLLIMNPPCAAYAKNGKRRGMEDPIMCHLHACVELGFHLDPTIWVWELVPGIFERDREFIDSMAARAASAGYKVTAFLTSAALHGCAQKRERFHFVASKVELDWSVLPRTPWSTVRKALAGLDGTQANSAPVTNGAIDALLPYLPPGTYINQLPDVILREHYRPRGKAWEGPQRPGVSRIRMSWDGPCATIVGGPSVVHPDQDRFLTVRESARLMGFPDSHILSDGGDGYAECGKGLTVYTARALCTVLHDGVRQQRVLNDTSFTIVDVREEAAGIPGLTSSEESRREWFRAKHGSEWPGRAPAVSHNAKPKVPSSSMKIATSSATVKELLPDSIAVYDATTTDVLLEDCRDVMGAFRVATTFQSCKAGRRIFVVSDATKPLLEAHMASGNVRLVDSIEPVIAELNENAMRLKLVAMIASINVQSLSDAIAALEQFMPDVSEEEDEDPDTSEEVE